MRAGSLAGGLVLLSLGAIVALPANAQLNASDFRAAVAACSQPVIDLLPQCEGVRTQLTLYTTAYAVGGLMVAIGIGATAFGAVAKPKASIPMHPYGAPLPAPQGAREFGLPVSPPATQPAHPPPQPAVPPLTPLAHPPPQAAVPTRKKNLTTIVVSAVVGVVLTMVLALAVPGLLRTAQQSAPSPQITITEWSASWTAGCIFLGLDPPHRLTYSFTLTNTGHADGYATVWFYVDGENVASSRFLIPDRATYSTFYHVYVGDCATHSWGMQVGNVERA